jgi:oligopeptide/dipeptide ABC transporter ATP-binding protein
MKMDNDRETILELKRIVKIYRTKGSFFGAHGKEVIALNALSIKIMRGEIFGLVGESGSGKTTAGRLIVRLEKPEQGEIYLNGHDMAGLKGKALKDFPRKVQMIFQDPYQSLNPQLSAFDTISEPLVIHKIGNAEDREDAVWQTMKSVGLSPPDDFVNRYPHQLSGGQRQRVAIARVMVLNPDFVVADEPTSMLDASISAQIFNILLEMREKLQVTFLFITHSLSAARYLCDRIAVIYKGNMMELGSADQVIQNPKHPYTKALIDALPKFGQHCEVNHYGTLLPAERETYDDSGCPFFTRCRVANKTKCSLERPLLKETEDSHWVACFYAENG